MNSSIFQKFCKYVSLNVIGMLGMSCYILADTFFIAQALGTAGLAALNYSISIFSILQGVGLMLGIGGATRFSISRQNGKHEHANAVFSHAILLSGGASLLFLLIAFFFTPALSSLLGADAGTLPLTVSYLQTILFFAPFFLLNNILLAFTRNDNSPKLSMVAMLSSSFCNIVLDYVFIFPLSMGMFGAALATGLSPIISICVLSAHFLRPHCSFSFRRYALRLTTFFDVLSLGFSAFVGELASAVSLIAFNLVLLGLAGTTGVAAYGIVANIALIVTAIFTGMAQGMQPLASAYYGKQEHPALRTVLRYGLIGALTLSVLIYLTVFFLADPIIALFNQAGDTQLATLAKGGLQIYFIGYLFASTNVLTAAFLSATARPKAAFTIALLRSSALLLPLLFVLSSTMQLPGVWMSFVCTEAVVCLCSVLQLRRRAVPASVPR